jgi:hypothetical protein
MSPAETFHPHREKLGQSACPWQAKKKKEK